MFFREEHLDEADRRLQEAERLCRGFGDRYGVQKTVGNLGLIAQCRGDERTATRCYLEAEAICRELNVQVDLGICLVNRAVLLLSVSRKPDEAEPIAREAVEIFTRCGNPHAERAERLLRAIRPHSDWLCVQNTKWLAVTADSQIGDWDGCQTRSRTHEWRIAET